MEHISGEIDKQVTSITLNNEEWTQQLRSYMRHVFAHERGDSLLHFLEKVMSGLEGSVLPSLFPTALNELSTLVTRSIQNNLHLGQQPDYYQQLLDHVRNVYELFESSNEEFSRNSEAKLLINTLHLNSQSTEDLILQYLASLADKRDLQFSEEKNVCSVNLKLGWVKVTNDAASIFVKAINGVNFPALDTLTQSCDPYIRLALRPFLLFPCHQHFPKTTKIRHQTLNPVFNEILQFDVPLMVMYTHGAVLSVMGLDKDTWSPNDLAGRCFIHLAQIPQLKWKDGVSDLDELLSKEPTVGCKLEMPTEANTGAFKVLKERQEWDPMAQVTVESELYMIRNRSLPRNFYDENQWECTCGSGVQGKLRQIFFRSKRCLRHSVSMPVHAVTAALENVHIEKHPTI